MEIYLLPILFVIASTRIEETVSIECIEPRHPETRTFSSLAAYQGNKIPFHPRNSTLGNYVAFNFKAVDNLPKNVFVTFDSEHIIKVDLNGKSIRKIDEGAFSSLSCLLYLTMKNNSLKELKWKTFEGLRNLKELVLSGNELKELPDMAFDPLTRLRYLDLSYNRLQKLSILTFLNLSKLENLNLQHNNLVYIQPEVFSPLQILTTLDLSFNKLAHDKFQKWILDNLENLNLSGNYLRSFDTSLNYTFRSLQILNLSSNYLTEFNVHGLRKNFQMLTIIDLNNNYWQCDEVTRILHYLADSKIRTPSRNTSEINELGIDCDNKTQISYDFIETTTIPPTSTTQTNNSPSNAKNVKFVQEIKNLALKNDEVLYEISGMRKLLVLCLLFFVLCVIVYASVQVGLCDSIKQKFNRRRRYIDTSVQNNYSMLST